MADSGPASLRSAPSLWRSGSDAHPRHPLILRGWCVPQGKAGGDSTSSLLGGEIWTDIVGGRAVVDENSLYALAEPLAVVFDESHHTAAVRYTPPHLDTAGPRSQ